MATEGAFIQPVVTRFDGHYDHWAMLMENFLQSKEYWEQKLKDLKAKNYLFQALDRSILETIINKDTSKSIWDSVNEYVARILVITNKMKKNGGDLKDFAIVEKILRSMTPKFNYVVCSIVESKDTSMLSLDELQSNLLVHEQRMSNTVHEEHALKVTHGNQYAGRGRGRGGFGGRGRGRSGQNFNKAMVECFACHKLGHFQWECNKGVENFAES
uniref:Retrovirus-related Pol polyprotein from transposon TNT 1-94 n=1 Tax=Cajanus cajan TaxID=3821 RepID=A0A151SFZ7_CAJCA|nr:hypothetical protein KK1_024287 [Cajanus cajan]